MPHSVYHNIETDHCLHTHKCETPQITRWINLFGGYLHTKIYSVSQQRHLYEVCESGDFRRRRFLRRNLKRDKWTTQPNNTCTIFQAASANFKSTSRRVNSSVVMYLMSQQILRFILWWRYRGARVAMSSSSILTPYAARHAIWCACDNIAIAIDVLEALVRIIGSKYLSIGFIQHAPNNSSLLMDKNYSACVINSFNRNRVHSPLSWRDITSCRQSSVNIHYIQLAHLFCAQNSHRILFDILKHYTMAADTAGILFAISYVRFCKFVWSFTEEISWDLRAINRDTQTYLLLHIILHYYTCTRHSLIIIMYGHSKQHVYVEYANTWIFREHISNADKNVFKTNKLIMNSGRRKSNARLILLLIACLFNQWQLKWLRVCRNICIVYIIRGRFIESFFPFIRFSA